MQRAFVIRPFNHKKDSSGREIDFETIHKELIEPAMKRAKLQGGTTTIVFDSGDIREDMFRLIIEADLVICDITLNNPNVFYELGCRHALRKKNTVLIKGCPVTDSAPFDIVSYRYLQYDLEKPAEQIDDLVRTIDETLAGSRKTDSPIFAAVPSLPDLNPAVVQEVPQDLTDEISRAKAAKSKGWLRLLASEVRGRRFQWPALRAIGTAQWRLGDYEAARETWRDILEGVPNDLDANFALANLLERQYRLEKRSELREESDQAIEAVLSNDSTTKEQRAEALALRGRNLKTLWRLNFESLDSLEARRESATNRNLINSYKAYYGAFLSDLNHFYSGLAALQMGMIARELANEAVWPDMFEGSDEAARFKSDLEQQIDLLRSAVRLAIQARRAQLDRKDESDVWVNVSQADYRFLTEDRDAPVVRSYRDNVPSDDAFVWHSAKGQLALFAGLGVKAERAEKVIREVDPLIDAGPVIGQHHLVVVVGHRIDEAGRPSPRFPADKEQLARELIRAELNALVDENSKIRVLASGAPGTDILAHEVCSELLITSRLCLPMPSAPFSSFAFNGLIPWQNRFLELIKTNPPIWLSDQDGLPRWLVGTGGDPWERGNRWVLEMAEADSAPRKTLIALWDCKETVDLPGGTADMVEIARRSGAFEIKIIGPEKLFP